MFEKEAEELFKSKPLGYEMKPELEIYTDGFNDGYNKANEWHYMKDGDLPKDEKLCLIWCGEKDFNTAEYVRDRFWDLCGGWLEVDEVIAWKEIVLPELKERNK